MFSKFRKLFPTIILILIFILASMIVLSYFEVDMSDNNGFGKLNRSLTIEGMNDIEVNKKLMEELRTTDIIDKLRNKLGKKKIENIKAIVENNLNI